VTDTRRSRRDLLKMIGASPIVATAALSRPASAQALHQTPAAASHPASPAPRPSLAIHSLTLQWTNMEEAVAVAVEAGYTSIAWAARPGAHILPENVARDLPKAVDLAHKAGLSTPLIITPLRDASTANAEVYLDTMRGLGIRHYLCPQFGSYDYTKDLAPQLEALKPRIASLAKLNEKYGTTAMYHTEGSAGLIGGGVWDLWLAVRDFDPAVVGINYDLGHATMKGGPEWWESIRFAHKHMLAMSLKDIKWVKKADAVRGPRRTDPSADWPWAAEYVVPGEGMVNFKSAFQYLKSITFAGPIFTYHEYFVEVPGAAQPVNMLGASMPNFKLEMPKAQYVSCLRRDREFYTRLMADVGLV
jgi:sugar phosphate isomerase/epimerase